MQNKKIKLYYICHLTQKKNILNKEDQNGIKGPTEPLNGKKER